MLNTITGDRRVCILTLIMYSLHRVPELTQHAFDFLFAWRVFHGTFWAIVAKTIPRVLLQVGNRQHFVAVTLNANLRQIRACKATVTTLTAKPEYPDDLSFERFSTASQCFLQLANVLAERPGLQRALQGVRVLAPMAEEVPLMLLNRILAPRCCAIKHEVELHLLFDVL